MFAQSKGGNYSLTNGASDVADAVDFDGASDYLSRASDLAGNADGKTFTFSIFGWRNATGALHTIYDNGKITIQINASDQVIITGKNAAGTTILSATATASTIQKQTFDSLLISIDLVNTANRSIYIGDAAATVTWTTYTNDALDWTATTHAVGAVYSGAASKYTGRLSSLFLDYTYRDLSIESNRRLFITADRKPAANQAALNPILYLPLNDPAQPGNNLGTGGNFNLAGVVARSGRGPNQFNGVYSTLNGAGQYLSKSTNLTGASNGKQLTVAFSFSTNNTSAQQLFNFAENTSERVWAYKSGANAVINCRNSAGIDIFQVVFPYVVNRNYHVVLSIDLSNAANRALSVNGATNLATWTIYTNDSFAISYSTPNIRVASSPSGTQQLTGNLGNVFFDTKYIDLSQPANLAKFVTGTGIDAKPADLGANGEKPFGTLPLIYLPMYGNNAGKNYGAGGDFTVNSGPFVGARGPNEFWGNKAVFNGSTGKLNRGASLTGISDSKTFSFAFNLNKTASVLYTLLDTTGATLRITVNASNQLVLLAKNSAGSTILSATVTTAIANTTNTEVLVCIDLANSANRFVYLNDVAASVTWATYTNDFVDLTVVDTCIGSEVAGANYLSGSLAECYFSTSYIDFSQEANRLKFRDAFGNPVDLAPQIAAGTLPNPAIYMRFDPANFGKNSGTGGDFTVSGTITDGGQL